MAVLLALSTNPHSAEQETTYPALFLRRCPPVLKYHLDCSAIVVQDLPELQLWAYI